MSVSKGTRLFKIASQINIGKDAIVDYLQSKGFDVENKPTAVLTDEMVSVVLDKFQKEVKAAEKQREKVEKIKRATRPGHEDGHPYEGHEAAPAAPAPVAEQPVEAAPAPAPETPAPAPAPAPAPVEIRAEAPREAAAPEAPRVEVPEPAPAPVPEAPRAQAPAEPAAPVQPEPVAERAPEPKAETPAPAPAPQAPAPIEARREEARQEEPRPEAPAPVEARIETPAEPEARVETPAPAEAPAAPVAPQAAAPAAPQAAAPDATEASGESEGDAEGDSAEGEEDASDPTRRKKKQRKKIVEVQYQPGQMPQLKGLTVVGKINLEPKAPLRRDRNDRNDRPDRGGDRPDRGGERGDRGGDRGPGGGPRREGMPNRGPGGPPHGDRRPPREGGAPGGGGRGFGQLAGMGSGGNRPGGPGGFRPSNAGPVNPADRFGPNKEKAMSERERAKKKRKGAAAPRQAVNQDDVDRAIRATLAGMDESSVVSSRSKLRQRKRAEREERETRRQEELAGEATVLKVSEFVTTGELATLMDASASEIISKCFSLGLMVTINQRLDKDTITLIADDFGYSVDFLADTSVATIEDEVDAPEVLTGRPPIVTIMGHVDHGKTSLLDFIRRANVVAGESGGITQHIGAYRVQTQTGRQIAFLDTPGHEAFTAMRARGAQVTDIVVLVVAADDSVMPQTIEAISHAQAANVPIVVAINKVDKPDSQPERIKQQLTNYGILVEDWGGKHQAVELSAKTGANVDLLLEKILLEAEFLDLKANPERAARGVVIEAHVDKGRGNMATVMVQKGTLRVGDPFVAGTFAGRVRAMYDERMNRVEEAGPSTPVAVTGFDGLPEAGDTFIVASSEVEARDIATQRMQLRREQQFRQVRHITLDEISQQIQLGGVKELRLIVKADVSGSLEALTDSLQKLSRDEVRVDILHRGVGAISESDVMLAAASNAVIVGFHVAPTANARRIADNETVDIRLYSIIYDCINEIQLALEGLLSPDLKEEITSTIEVRQVFKISRLGTIAGCFVQSGKITRNDKIRVLRNGFAVFKGGLSSLKRLKDDVREVDAGYECGIMLQGFNEFEEGDIIEGYKVIEVKRKLT